MDPYQDGEEHHEEDEMAEEDLDDVFLIEMHKRLVAMKQERKKAEKDADVLDLKLKILKNEEQKVVKRIEVTRKKTNEKLMTLQKMQEELEMKREYKERKEEELKRLKEDAKKRKEEYKNNIELKRAEKKKQIEEEMKLLKLQKQYNEDLAKFIKMEEMNQNITKYEQIKKHHQTMEERKQIKEIERKMKLKNDLQSKLEEEAFLKLKAEQKLEELGQEESEMIKRLKATTRIHDNLCQDLNKLNLSSSKNLQSLSTKEISRVRNNSCDTKAYNNL